MGGADCSDGGSRILSPPDGRENDVISMHKCRCTGSRGMLGRCKLTVGAFDQRPVRGWWLRTPSTICCRHTCSYPEPLLRAVPLFGWSPATGFLSHILPASASSSSLPNSIFLSHHFSSSLQRQPTEHGATRAKTAGPCGVEFNSSN